jgi:uncharacterized protein YlxW (UPF0749 family)
LNPYILISALSRENKELSQKKQDKQNEIESLEAKKNKLEIEMAIKHKIMYARLLLPLI